MPGTLIPPWFVRNVPTCDDLVVVSIIWGISLGLSLFGVIRAGNQTYHQWKRTRRITTYMVLIWLELIASTIIGGIGWGYVYQTIPPSFEYFFCLLILWIIQVHCIMQIIVNRIALLAVSPKTVRRLKWGVFTFLVLINISVFCIWIPARLQISQRWRHINNIWDRIEKGLFALVDLCLNLYFIHLVRSSLINYGLKKYVLLYRFNIFIIMISIGMDVMIIAMMSLSNTFLYVLFHPLAYLVKLHIEMWMAELIAKIVKSTGSGTSCHCACHNFHIRHQSIDVPQHSPKNRSDSLAPTTGRFRQSWPLWPGRAHMRDGLNDNNDEIELNRRTQKAPRIEGYRLNSRSWVHRHSLKDCELGLSSVSSSMGRSCKSNDHQD